MKLSTRIRTSRVRAGLSQAELAESLGVSRSELREAVQAAGPMAEAVRNHLAQKG